MNAGIDRMQIGYFIGLAIGSIRSICSAAAFLLLLQGCAALPDNNQRTTSSAIDPAANTMFRRSLQPEIDKHPGKSGFRILDDGLDAFVARAVLAAHAERSIDLQYYLFHDDLIGKLLALQLLRAADRGVRVRLLLDDIDQGAKDEVTLLLDSHPNIEIRQFNPFVRSAVTSLQFITRFGTVTRRMHNKSFTVDNQLSVVGGRNIGEEYFAAHPDLDFHDLDVLAVGPVVPEVSVSFDKYWSSELAYPIAALVDKSPSPGRFRAMRVFLEDYAIQQRESEYARALRDSPLARQLSREEPLQFHWGEAEATYDEPEKILAGLDQTDLHLSSSIEPYINRLQKELIIVSAYFIPGADGVALFRKLIERGVRVRILTNALSSTDVSIVHAGYSKYRRQLLAAGVELYEMNEPIVRESSQSRSWLGDSSKSSLHAKAFIFDREYMFIGSLNLDPRALEQNTEMGIIFRSPEIGGEMGRGFDRKIDELGFRLELYESPGGGFSIRWRAQRGGETEYYYVDPYTSFIRRFLVGLAGWLPIESQL